MKQFLCFAALCLLVAGSGCKKETAVTPPAVVATIVSASYPPTEENSYFIYTASVELKKTDGTYREKKLLSGSGKLTFDKLTPGEYWINEETTRQSETFILGVNEKREITFGIP